MKRMKKWKDAIGEIVIVLSIDEVLNDKNYQGIRNDELSKQYEDELMDISKKQT